MIDKLFSLAGKVAIITGAGGLLGMQHANVLSGAGASVVLTDCLSEGELAKRIKLQPARGKRQQALFVSADVCEESSVQELLRRTLKKFGRVDILVNNAAMNDMAESASRTPVALERYPVESWRRMLDVNVTGTFLCAKFVGGAMAKQRTGGSIINIASTYGVVGPDQSLYLRSDRSRLMYKSPAYSASKGAVLALTRHLASYWGRKRVRVNALSPGGVENEQEDFFVKNYSARTMLGRMARSSDYQGAILFLASDASAYMTGANLIVDGGWTAW
jgi:NAD(P)-dependent dehydrogenase (short-subunit alcohol dehydrogenase family)